MLIFCLILVVTHVLLHVHTRILVLGNLHLNVTIILELEAPEAAVAFIFEDKLLMSVSDQFYSCRIGF